MIAAKAVMALIVAVIVVPFAFLVFVVVAHVVVFIQPLQDND